jgi:hypothetical protein
MNHMMKEPAVSLHAALLRARVMAIALMLMPLPTAAAGFGSDDDNPIVAGMRAMLNAMGFSGRDEGPFPDDDPFSSMDMGSSFGMSPWSTMGSMPGLGGNPWSSMGSMPGFGGSPWSGMVPGMSMPGFGSMPGMSMPGQMSPWSYARPEKWSNWMNQNARRVPGRADPDSPTRELDGLWVSQDGDKLWFRNGWVRVYRGTHSDARALIRGGYLFIGIPETKEVMQYEYGRRGEYLGLRDSSGTYRIFRRQR